MRLNNAELEDTFAEAFEMTYSRFLVTASSKKLAMAAASEACGYGTSIIGCSAEGGIESKIFTKEETPDSRIGVAVQLWARKSKIEWELINRIGQCILTAPTTAVWNLTESWEKLPVGEKLRFFGDGYESQAIVGGREVARIPIMLGEFVIEKKIGVGLGVAGGNIILQAENQKKAVLACEAASREAKKVSGVITPFVLGICASGSKVGSKKYKFMHATTNELFCPTLKDKVEGTKVKGGVNAVGEIVINGITEQKVREAMKLAITAASKTKGVRYITAANYGGTLGKVKINLGELFL